MVDEMVERVARRLCAASCGISDERLAHSAPNAWTIFVDGHWQLYEGLARTAIAAMREPTDEMANAGAAMNEFNVLSEARAVWQTMIDAALREDIPGSQSDSALLTSKKSALPLSNADT